MLEDQPQRIMAIMAHPDDMEFGVAGTLARWVRQGRQVTYVICTDGSKGTDDPELIPERLVPLRQREQCAAAAHVGAREVVFLPFVDGELDLHVHELRRELVRLMRHHKPHIVLCPDPTMRFRANRWINHPDHRAAGEAALDAVYPMARNRPSFPELLEEGLEPHVVGEVYLSPTNEPNVWIDIGETIDVKVAALMEHVSQLGGRDMSDLIRDRCKQTADGQPMQYAEAFRYIKLA